MSYVGSAQMCKFVRRLEELLFLTLTSGLQCFQGRSSKHARIAPL